MTVDEIISKVNDLMRRKRLAESEVVTAARPIISILKDYGAINSAKELEAKLFMVDALEQEILQIFMDNPETGMQAMCQQIMGK